VTTVGAAATDVSLVRFIAFDAATYALYTNLLQPG
jgi:hypothetical protein